MRYPCAGTRTPDDLTVLVYSPVHVPPHLVDLHVGLVDEPAIFDRVPTGAGRVERARGEPLHPPVEGDVVHVDAILGEELFEVPVGQPVPQVPAHR